MKFKIVKNVLIVRMDDNENLFENLEKIIKEKRLKSGIIVSVTGMLKDIELRYLTYPKEIGKYKSKNFKGPFEIVSLAGNFTFLKDKPIIHLHGVFANEKNKCVGGHLGKAKINATLEMFIILLNKKLEKKFDEKTGLNILDLN